MEGGQPIELILKVVQNPPFPLYLPIWEMQQLSDRTSVAHFGGHSCSEMIGHLLTWCIYASINFYLPGTFESGHIPHVLGPKGPVFHSGVNGLAFYLFLLSHFISILQN
eukprot:SAG11_NODE_90_length_17153_cov_63.471033_13_plen_109_part_00